MTVQPFQPVEFRLLSIRIGGKAAESLKKAMARMVLVPSSVAFAQFLKQTLLFLAVPLGVWLSRQTFILSQDNLDFVDFIN